MIDSYLLVGLLTWALFFVIGIVIGALWVHYKHKQRLVETIQLLRGKE